MKGGIAGTEGDSTYQRGAILGYRNHVIKEKKKGSEQLPATGILKKLFKNLIPARRQPE